MPWWGILLVIVGVQGAFLFVWWWLTRRNGHDLSALLDKLEKSAAKRLDEEREAERKAKETIAEAYRSLSDRQRQITEWYNESKAKIDDESKRAFEELAGDPSAVDRKLDELLGTHPNDPTPVVAVNPTGTVEEG